MLGYPRMTILKKHYCTLMKKPSRTIMRCLKTRTGIRLPPASLIVKQMPRAPRRHRGSRHFCGLQMTKMMHLHSRRRAAAVGPYLRFEAVLSMLPCVWCTCQKHGLAFGITKQNHEDFRISVLRSLKSIMAK